MRLLGCRPRYREKGGGDDAATTTEDLGAKTIDDNRRQGTRYGTQQSPEQDHPARVCERQLDEGITGIVEFPRPEKRTQPDEGGHQIGIQVRVGELGWTQRTGAKEVPDAGRHPHFINVAVQIRVALLQTPHAYPESNGQDAGQGDVDDPHTAHLTLLEQA
jgi:hypothetical protein